MNLLVTGAYGASKEQLNSLEKLGYSVFFMQNETDELPCSAEMVEAVICNGLFLHHDIEKFSSLKFIQLTSAGFDRVPMDYIKAHHIKVCNARGVYSIPMAEFALCGVLELYKKSRFFYENQKAHRWEKNRNLAELYGKNVLIIGCGNIGSECAKRFAAFGAEVSGVDIAPYDSTLFEKIYPLSDLDCRLLSADIVVLTLPLTEETKHLLNKCRFDKMKEGAVLVNISRGATVDAEALIEALKTNLGGAVLDVFETEPLEENSPLWDMGNVIITPHNSFVGEGNNQRLFDLALKNLEKEALR